MGRKIHLAQSVEGALKNWKLADWRDAAKLNEMTVSQIKEEFQNMLKDGIRVIPIGDECEGFSPQTGCPGHEIKNET